jgi:hypothetical protein
MTEHELAPNALMLVDLVLQLRAEIRMMAKRLGPGLLVSGPLDPLVIDIGLGATANERRKGWANSHQAILP